MQTPPKQPNLMCTPLLLLYPNVWAVQSPALSATKFSGFVLLILVTLGPAKPSLPPLPDMYPNLVIFCCFLRALT